MLSQSPRFTALTLVLIANAISTPMALAESEHSISVYVPKLALVKVQQKDHRFSFSTGSSTSTQRTQIAITSSDRNAVLKINSSRLYPGITLQISASENVCSLLKQDNPHGKMICQVGLKAIKDGELVLTAKRDSTVPDGNYAVTISPGIK